MSCKIFRGHIYFVHKDRNSIIVIIITSKYSLHNHGKYRKEFNRRGHQQMGTQSNSLKSNLVTEKYLLLSEYE